MKKRRYGGWAFFMHLFAVIAVLWGLTMGSALVRLWDTAAFCVVAAVEVILLGLSIVCGSKAPKRTAEEAAAQQRKYDRERAAAKEYWAERKRLDTTPIAAELISEEYLYRKHFLATASRAVIGAVLMGRPGAMLGIASGRAKTVERKAVFSVKYAGGREETEKVALNSPRFKELSALAEANSENF